MLKAYNSSLHGIEISWILLPNPFKHKNTMLLNDDSSKTSRLELLHLQKTFLLMPGKTPLLFQSLPSLLRCKAHLLRSFKTHTPAVNSVWLLFYLHAKLYCSLPGVGTVSSSLGSAEQKGALTFSWRPISDCMMQITHARKSLPRWLVNVMIAIAYLLHKFRLHN